MPTQTINPESGYTNNGFYDTVSAGDGGNLHQVIASDGSFWIAQATTESSTEHSIRFPLSTIAGVATVSKVSFAFTHRLGMLRSAWSKRPAATSTCSSAA